MTPVDRALALADAIVTGSGGEFKVGTSPLLIVADFPVKREHKSTALDKSNVADFSSSQSSAGSHRFFKTS